MNRRINSRVCRALFAAWVLAAVALWAVPAFGQTASAGPVSSRQLVNDPKSYDGQLVTITGEAIGEMMVRGDHSWLHLNDDAYAQRNIEDGATPAGYNSGMPVWVGTEFGKRVKTFGDYRHQGDIVQTTGLFHAACAVHGGDMDIHAADLLVEARGRTVTDRVQPWKIVVALILAAVSALFWLANRRQHARELRGWLAGGRRRR